MPRAMQASATSMTGIPTIPKMCSTPSCTSDSAITCEPFIVCWLIRLWDLLVLFACVSAVKLCVRVVGTCVECQCLVISNSLATGGVMNYPSISNDSYAPPRPHTRWCGCIKVLWGIRAIQGCGHWAQWKEVCSAIEYESIDLTSVNRLNLSEKNSDIYSKSCWRKGIRNAPDMSW